MAPEFSTKLLALGPSNRTSIKEQIVSLGRITTRIETLVRHLQASLPAPLTGFEGALVPMPGSKNYFSWLSVLLQHRTSMGEFLQGWLRDVSNKNGGSPIRRIKTISAHLCAPPLVVDAW